MKSLNFRTTGWITIVAGIMTISLPFAIAAVAGLASLNGIFAALGDILGVIAILLVIPAFIALGSSVMVEHHALGRAIQVLGVLGALSDFSHYFLFMSGIMSLDDAVIWNTIGRSLVGVAVLTFALLSRNNPNLGRLYLWFSLALGVTMAGSFIMLLIPMFLILNNVTVNEPKSSDRWVQALSVVGALIESVLSFLVLSKTITNEQALYGHVIGLGALAIAIFIFARNQPALRRRAIGLSLAWAWTVAFAFIGTGMQDVADQVFAGDTLEQANPILVILLFTMAPFFILGWPIWLLWTGRLLLKGQRLMLNLQTSP